MLSRPENITPIIEAITDLRPRRLVDVGAGFGKYGLLVREALASVEAEAGDLEPFDFVYLEAWEGAAYFVAELATLEAVYDRVVTRFADPTDHPAGFDVVLLIDVLEHLEHYAGAELVTALLDDNDAVLVSTPRGVHFYDEAYFGVDCPKHITQWLPGDLATLAPAARDISTEASIILVLTK